MLKGLLNAPVNSDTLNAIPPQQSSRRLNSHRQPAAEQLKLNKAPGSDQVVTAAALKHGGEAIIDQAHAFCAAVFEGSKPPWQWTTNKIAPIPKKGSRTEMANYHGISLMSTMAKLYNRVLLNRIRLVIDQVLRPNQAGFRPGRSTINQIHTLRRILEAAESNQLELVVTFVDFKKAFDSVNRAVMFAILRYNGIPAKVVDAIARMYTESKGAVLVGGKLSEPFDITTGVLQGDVLAPFLFIVVMDYVMSRSEQNFGFVYQPRTSTASRGHLEQRINDQDYADDEALLESSIARANEQLTTHCLEARGVGLEINVDKTEYMVINPRPSERNAQLLLNGKPIKRVENFKYLGANLKSSAYDLACRRGQAWAAFWALERIWRDKSIRLDLKINICKTVVLSVLSYGCET
jgi:hypothetical protein